MIDRPTIERIKDAADIYDVVSEFVSLKRVGANYRGLCPFHNDHTPSFYVSPSRRTCHCFVCGEGGDSVGFIMKHEQLTYPEALRWLANRYHIDIQEQELTDDQKKEQSEREAMFIVNDWAAKYFKDILHNDIDGRAIGMQYFRQRGVRDDIIERFQLGFCLSDRQAFSKAAIAKGYKEDYLVKTGLCYRKDNGELVDRFAGRVMFPWLGVSGKVVAFGGRVLDARTKGVSQKYVNSPDSDIYHKERELYGIFQAKKAISRENCVYMVEGYTDVISMHQCGLENVVANSGTALSEHQIHILHRFTPNIVLLYDGDAAGIKAALRGTDMLLKEGMNVKVLLLPDGDDPDSFAKKHNAEEFRKYIEEHQTDFIQFKTKVLLQGVTDPVKRSEAISSIIQSVSVIGDPIIRATYIQDCASRLGLSEQVLIAKMNENIRNYRSEQRKEEERRRRQQENPFQHQAGSASQQSAGYTQQSAGYTQQSAGYTQQQAGSAPQQQAGYTQQQAGSVSNQPGFTPNQGTTAQQQQYNLQQSQYDTQAQAGQSATQNSQMPPSPYDDMPPPDAFLPPEAFGEPSSSGGATYTQGGTSMPYQTQSVQPIAGRRNQTKKESVSDLIMKMIFQHGDEIILEDVETDDGETVNVTVAQFIQLDMSQDNLLFSVPLYNKILDEAVAHSGEDNFKAEQYFTLHPDYEISSLAIRLTADAVLLSKSLQMTLSQDQLREKVKHLLYDFRQEYVNARLEQLRIDIGLASDNPERMLELMTEYQQTQKIRNAIAKKIGSSLVS